MKFKSTQAHQFGPVMAYYFYVLQSETTGRFYMGHTENLPKRCIFEHNNSRTVSSQASRPLRSFPYRGIFNAG